MSFQKHYDILEAQRITEKSSLCAQHNQYVFKVVKDATKTDISKAIEEIYNVKVKSCNVVNRKGEVSRKT